MNNSAVKVLLVDDNADNLFLLETLLKSDDVQVVLAQSGIEALEKLKVHEVALALLDVPMPNMAGEGAAMVYSQTEDERIRWIAERIRSGGYRMAKLIGELMDFSNVRLNGSLPVYPAAADILQIATKAVSEQQLANAQASIEIIHSGDFNGTWDETRLAQVFSNLITNALIHGDRTAPVKVMLEGQDPHTLQIALENNGRIPEAVLPRIFEPFSTSARNGSGGSGLGLGLYIVRQIVIAHGGSIRIETREPSSTRFVIHLPRQAAGSNTQQQSACA